MKIWNLDTTKVGDLEAAEAVLERMRRTKNRKEKGIEIPCVATHFMVVVPTMMTDDDDDDDELVVQQVWLSIND